MKATVFHAAGDVRVEDVPDPKVQDSTDAVVRITHACICGSDLWFYRGVWDWQQGYRCGHEWMGVVEDVGSDVQNFKPGDRVIAPFTYSDGNCEFCDNELYTSCIHGNSWGGADADGGQAEAIRAPFADGTLVKLPDAVENDDRLLKAILPLTDVMGTGHHAAVSAKVGPGSVVAVVGDGAVGLSGVLAARRLGAGRIILCGRHDERIAVAKQFGATDVVKERGEEGIAKLREMTDGGAPHVLEAVGNKGSMELAIGAVRAGGTIGYVGVPTEEIAFGGLFGNNVTLAGGVAPVRAYIPELMEDVVAGKIDPSPVFDKTVDLNGVPEGYAAMDDRSAIKTMVVL
ncbi:alcohol dehydrogenase catalytic domain-containing protein [Rubrobacter indicoceani]|uniref:alcohol dehydrogenase catalytic domain-containing protein n=1 Tax=Rubrobacter indicoceani TaxID=2051957 RepID=UPI000E5A7E4F|nr:alcohol dehydrogenase catalytic domain-containing protein [Rubrobacter indicoceani]